jgi:hypothetical protein
MRFILLALPIVLLPVLLFGQYMGQGGNGVIRPSTTPTQLKQLPLAALWFVEKWIEAGFDMPTDPEKLFSWDQYLVAVTDGKYQEYDLVIFTERDSIDNQFALSIENFDPSDTSPKLAVMRSGGTGLILMNGIEKSLIKGLIRPKKRRAESES